MASELGVWVSWSGLGVLFISSLLFVSCSSPFLFLVMGSAEELPFFWLVLREVFSTATFSAMLGP